MASPNDLEPLHFEANALAPSAEVWRGSHHCPIRKFRRPPIPTNGRLVDVTGVDA